MSAATQHTACPVTGAWDQDVRQQLWAARHTLKVHRALHLLFSDASNAAPGVLGREGQLDIALFPRGGVTTWLAPPSLLGVGRSWPWGQPGTRICCSKSWAAQLLMWIKERVGVIDVKEVELEEWGR